MKTAAEIMNSDVPRATAGDEANRVAKKMADEHHNHLSVVDADGRLAGMVMRADALAALVDAE
jgi:CBS-domain-containing membrane protein